MNHGEIRNENSEPGFSSHRAKHICVSRMRFKYHWCPFDIRIIYKYIYLIFCKCWLLLGKLKWKSYSSFHSLIRSKVIYIFKYMFLNHVQVIYNTFKCFVLFSNTVKKISYNKKCYLFFKLLNPFYRFLFEAFYLLENLANFFVNPFFPFSYILLMNLVKRVIFLLRNRFSTK